MRKRLLLIGAVLTLLSLLLSLFSLTRLKPLGDGPRPEDSLSRIDFGRQGIDRLCDRPSDYVRVGLAAIYTPRLASTYFFVHDSGTSSLLAAGVLRATPSSFLVPGRVHRYSVGAVCRNHCVDLVLTSQLLGESGLPRMATHCR